MFVVMGAIELLLLLAVVGGVSLLLYVLFHKGGEAEASDALGTETRCPRCGHMNPTHANFCAHCGRGLE